MLPGLCSSHGKKTFHTPFTVKKLNIFVNISITETKNIAQKIGHLTDICPIFHAISSILVLIYLLSET